MAFFYSIWLYLPLWDFVTNWGRATLYYSYMSCYKVVLSCPEGGKQRGSFHDEKTQLTKLWKKCITKFFETFFEWSSPHRTLYDFHNSTDTLKFWTEKRAINIIFVFHLILMKLGEVVVIYVYYNITKFHQNRMKNKKVLWMCCPLRFC